MMLYFGTLSCPRISPSGNFAVCTLKYHFLSCRSPICSAESVVTPFIGLSRLPSIGTTGGAIAQPSPVVANGVVYIGSQDHKMYAIDALSGQVLWTYVTGDIIGDSAAVADGVLYFGSFDKNLYAFHLG